MTTGTNDARPVALVTGGAGGLGRVITSVLVSDGFRVVMVDINADKLAAATENMNSREPDHVWALTADITDEKSVEACVSSVEERWGPVDALVNNAGIEPDHHILDLDMSVWDATFDVNVRAPMLFVKHCAPSWVTHTRGTVVFIGSRTWLSGSTHVAYASSKAAVVGLARSIAMELGPSGVTANVVAPSFVRTPLHTEEWIEDHAGAFVAMSPLQRLIDPIDVAHAVAFLASPRGRNVTGEVLNVAAGAHLAPVVRLD